MTADEINKHWNECKQWEGSATAKLNQSELVEYHRRVNFIQSTIHSFNLLSERIEEKRLLIREKQKKKDRNNLIIVVVILFVLFVPPFFSSGLSDAEFIGFLVLGLFFLLDREFSELKNHFELKNDDANLEFLQRDISSCGVSVETIKKLRKLQNQRTRNDESGVETEQSFTILVNLYHYAIRYEIFQTLTQHQFDNFADWYSFTLTE
jgi:hypothetical protein